ncbi:kinesin light chain [Ceratobasidium sp. AG-Ba]|nr:kinesin light chain [Ceratobasidium sp. AG-Ba]
MSESGDVTNGVKILVIEGGGARGLSSLIVLDELMTRLQFKMKLNRQPTVRDHFDIVAGTGTGAVIACMVGRLGMPIQKAIQHYVKLAEIFSERKWIGVTTYKTTKLQDALKGMIREVTGDEGTQMMDTSADGDKCRTMVFAMSAHNMNASLPCIFRSYHGVSNQMPDSPLWKVLSATMAHPEMFKPIEIGPDYLRQTFVDGGLGCNNPTAHVLAEVNAIMPYRSLSTILCIGTGHPNTIQLPQRTTFSKLMPSSVLALTKNIALDAERVAQEMEVRFHSAEDVYFRFSVDQGMQSVEAGEWEKLPQVAANAQAYLRGPRVSKSVDKAVASIERRDAKIVDKADSAIRNVFPNPTTRYKACPAPTPVFTGRQDTIDQIVECICKGDTQRCVFVLYGLGGSGKTQLALKAVQQTHDKWTDIVFVDATTHETAAAALAEFAKQKKIGESHEEGLQWLGNRRERWLMIIDNADDPKVDIRQYFPTGDTGSILVTTRIDQYALLSQGPKSEHMVSSMRPDEAMELLLRTAKIEAHDLTTEVHEAAVRLLESLGYLALAIVQAGAYMFSSKRTIVEYLDMFTHHRQQTLEKYNQLLVRVDNYQKSVYTTWHMSYILLSIHAQRLLHLMAFMHHTDISEDTFRRAATTLKTYKPIVPETERESEARAYLTSCLQPYLDSSNAWNSSVFLDTMAGLLSYSLISYDHVNKTYHLHVLVHDWAGTVAGDAIDIAVERTSLLLALSVGYEDTIASLEYRRRVEPHINRLLGRQERPSANNASRFETVYHHTGNWQQQESMLLVALTGRREALGEGNDATLTTMNNLANVYGQQGRYQEAVSLLQKVVEIRKRVSGDEYRPTLTAMRNLARTYYDLAQFEDAQSLNLHILETCNRAYGDNHADTLSSMHQLALNYQAQKRHDEAEALLTKVVDGRKRVKGDEHPDTLTSMHVLASTYCDQGRYGEAEAMQKYVLQVKKRRLGDEHPYTLSTMNNLALTYRLMGRHDEAERLQVEVLDARRRAYGENHPKTLINMGNLACTYRDQGRYDEAEELAKRVVDARKHVFGAGHPSTLASMRSLLKTYKLMGDRRRQEHGALQDQIRELEAGRS